MEKKIFENKHGLRGEITIPSDKSITHRALILSAIAGGGNEVKNISLGKDCKSTINVLEKLGLKFEYTSTRDIKINKTVFKKPKGELFCGNSGTTMRLMTGVLAGQDFDSKLTGDESLSNRPMKRIITPLKEMGAKITTSNNKAPIVIQGSKIKGISYESELSSAQVKSCVLLAGLQADGKTVFKEPYESRNHTERMLELFGAKILKNKNITTIEKSKLNAKNIEIPGDISSAAFFIVSALITPKSDITIKNVGLNPTRIGILDVIKKMGANFEILNKKTASNEEVGDLRIKYSELKATTIEGEIIPRIIDEIPIIAVLATQAKGKTLIKDAYDLRNKESDRLHATTKELKKLGAKIKETEDGLEIVGKSALKGGAELDTHCDHRIAMSLYIACLISENPSIIRNFEWINISFPEFEQLFKDLS